MSKCSSTLDDRAALVQTINGLFGGADIPAHHFNKALERARNGIAQAPLDSRHVAAWLAICADLRGQAAELMAIVDAALEDAFRVGTDFQAELAAEEAARAAAEAEARRRAADEAALAREVKVLEEEERQALEEKARKRLAAAGA